MVVRGLYLTDMVVDWENVTGRAVGVRAWGVAGPSRGCCALFIPGIYPEVSGITGVTQMRKISRFVGLRGLALGLAPALAFGAASSLAHGQCTGFSITASTGATIVPGVTDTT